MRLKRLLQRFLIPRAFISLYYYLKFKARVSPRAEVELSPNIMLGKNVTIPSFSKLKATGGQIRIGENSGFAISAFVASERAGITIGRDCIFGAHAVIVDSSYGYSEPEVPYKRQSIVSKGITVGDNVYVGSNVTIADGSRIGDNCIVVSNSLINRHYPPNCILQGAPAKIILRI